MNYQLDYYPLNFIRPAGTSRGVMLRKQSWLLTFADKGVKGIGEISIIEDLSIEFTNKEDFELKIHEFCSQIIEGNNENLNKIDELKYFPSILFGIESALLDLQNGGIQKYFENDFYYGTKKIPINGLVWMGDETFMKEQIHIKLKDGYTTIKMKIGAIDLESEMALLNSIRAEYSSDQITLRVDANGAFTEEESIQLLSDLSHLKIHSIEQPIKAGNWSAMSRLCMNPKTPIALDEELIGIYDRSKKIELLDAIRPQYIILKPSLHGGIRGTNEWIELAEQRNIQWWMTSALESNVGLNVICQLTAEYDNELPQGLGTGSLYSNNIKSDLVVEKGMIFNNTDFTDHRHQITFKKSR